MRVYYTPFFHAKDGEFTALQHASERQRALTLPLFDIGYFTDKQRMRARFSGKATPMCAYLDFIANEISAAFPAGPVMVDTYAWPVEQLTETGDLPIAFAIKALLNRERNVVPVIGLDRWDSPAYQLALKSLEIDEFAIWAIRLDSSDIEDAADPDHFLGRLQDVRKTLGLVPKQIGILLDFGDITGTSLEKIDEQTNRVLLLLASSGYRFYSICGCSLPPSINMAVKTPNSEATIMRKEMLAWQTARTAHPTLPIAYGDYGVRGPTSKDIQNPHVNGKIRYTIANAFYVARGQSVQHDDGDQMYRLANLIASSPHYQGPKFSWGDAELYRRAIREKKVGPGNSNSWIQFDTNHHVAWVVLEVEEVEHALAAVPVEV